MLPNDDMQLVSLLADVTAENSKDEKGAGGKWVKMHMDLAEKRTLL